MVAAPAAGPESPEDDAKGSRTDGKGEYHTHDDRHDNAHDQRLLNRAPIDDITKACHDR